MSEYLSQYKSELIEHYIKNQISNAEKDTLHALLQRSNRTTATERDIFAQLTLWVLLNAPATTRENVNVKTTCSLPLEEIRTLKTSEKVQEICAISECVIINSCYTIW